MTGTPRLYTTGRSYEEFRRSGREGTSDGLKHHRVLAYAWGLIDSLEAPVEVDHRVECRWLNIEPNLEPMDPGDHRRRTRHRARERRLDPEEYQQTVTEVMG